MLIAVLYGQMLNQVQHDARSKGVVIQTSVIMNNVITNNVIPNLFTHYAILIVF
jgi:hypothetical protein